MMNVELMQAARAAAAVGMPSTRAECVQRFPMYCRDQMFLEGIGLIEGGVARDWAHLAIVCEEQMSEVEDTLRNALVS
jgi:hypothetical protein